MEMRRNGNVTVPIFFEMVLVHISYSLRVSLLMDRARLVMTTSRCCIATETVTISFVYIQMALSVRQKYNDFSVLVNSVARQWNAREMFQSG